MAENKTLTMVLNKEDEGLFARLKLHLQKKTGITKLPEAEVVRQCIRSMAKQEKVK